MGYRMKNFNIGMKRVDNGYILYEYVYERNSTSTADTDVLDFINEKVFLNITDLIEYLKEHFKVYEKQ